MCLRKDPLHTRAGWQCLFYLTDGVDAVVLLGLLVVEAEDMCGPHVLLPDDPRPDPVLAHQPAPANCLI